MRNLRIVCLIFIWSQLFSAIAEEWSCHVDFESQCTIDPHGCSAYGAKNDGNTKPVFARFDTEGNFRVCMYTGCYEGKGVVHTTEPYLSISKNRVNWTGTQGESTNVFIFLDRKENIGAFKAISFVQPIICAEINGK